MARDKRIANRILYLKEGTNVKQKKIGKNIMFVFVFFIIILTIIYINHRIQLNRESELRIPYGQLVQVDGHNMSVYVEGSGEKTLVFMSGGGTCSPILDFKSLYSLLSDEYRVVVVEKFGYGFSDVVNKERDISSVLEDTRTALKEAGVEAPYILCPHSMSGIEALYWAQEYPEEVSAIVGLDMAVPQAYQDYKINMLMLKLSQFAAKAGITRVLPGLSESDAIKYGTLSEDDKEVYRAVFYSRTATATMMNEVRSIKGSAGIVGKDDVPQIPMLLFVSDGTGTGWDKDVWHSYQKNFIEQNEKGKILELDCPHYVHDYEYETISEKVKEFISDL